jgi:hypothetical protein
MMTHREKFSKLLQVYATIQPFRAPDFTNKMVSDFWFCEFGHLTLEELKHGLDHWIRNESWFPSIADIRKSLGVHDEDPETQCRQVAANIQAAMRKFGWAREIEAKTWLGDLAWSVVNGVGGWQFLSDVTLVNHATVFAQIRELAKSYLITKRFPINDDKKLKLQSKAKEALSIASAAIRPLEKQSERITNPESNT